MTVPDNYFSDADGSAESFDRSAHEAILQLRELHLMVGSLVDAIEGTGGTNLTDAIYGVSEMRSAEGANIPDALVGIAMAIRDLASAVRGPTEK